MKNSEKPSQREESRIFNVPIRRLAARLQTLVQRGVLRPHGVTIQEWRVMWSLAREGDTHLRELARRASVDAAHASRLLKKLESRNLISRATDPTDSRRTMFHITEEGRQFYELVRPKAVAVSDEFRNLYTATEYQTMMSLIDRALLRADELLDKDVPNDD